MNSSLAAVALAFAVTSCSTADPSNRQAWRAPSQLQTHHSVTLGKSKAIPTNAPGAGLPSPWSWVNVLRGDSYALDDVARRLEPKAKVTCDPSPLKTYRGTSVVYWGSVLIDPAFTERLSRFETIINEVALEVYGRTPSKLLHAGAYSCRTSRNRSSRLSEHALGNALDVVGFSFARATKEQKPLTNELVRGAFKVTVAQHWNAERSAVGRLHREFLRKLADRVVSADVFRVALGPSHPGHGDHLHFDMSPWNYTHL